MPIWITTTSISKMKYFIYRQMKSTLGPVSSLDLESITSSKAAKSHLREDDPHYLNPCAHAYIDNTNTTNRVVERRSRDKDAKTVTSPDITQPKRVYVQHAMPSIAISKTSTPLQRWLLLVSPL